MEEALSAEGSNESIYSSDLEDMHANIIFIHFTYMHKKQIIFCLE